MRHPSSNGSAARRIQRVLVTGAAGFIGSHLAEALLEGGYDVVGVDAFTDSYPRWYKERNLLALRRDPRFELVELDLRSDPLDALLEGVDVVVNEAAFPGLVRSWSEVDSYVGCNVVALSRLVDAAARAGVRRFVQASTSSVYGAEATGDELRPTRPVSPYGMSKLAAEHLLLAHARAHDFPVMILRYFSIYGPRQRPDMAYHIMIEQIRAGRPVTVFGDGRQARCNTYISDCVAGTIAAMRGAELGEIYNIGGGERLELRDAIALIAETLGHRTSIRYEPGRPGDQRLTAPDTAKAREAFGYQPTVAPTAGLRRQVGWHLDTLDGDRATRWAQPPDAQPVVDPTALAAFSPEAV